MSDQEDDIQIELATQESVDKYFEVNLVKRVLVAFKGQKQWFPRVLR